MDKTFNANIKIQVSATKSYINIKKRNFFNLAIFSGFNITPIMNDKIFFILLSLYLISSSEVNASDCGQKLVIDHDGGADDAIAITMSLLYEKYFDGPNVVALTTSYGNVNLSQAIINSDRILKLCGRQDIPIYSGANRTLISGIVTDYYFGFDGLGDDGYMPTGPIKIKNEHSAVALIELSKKYEGKLIILAIGPLTNVALAVRLDPEFIDRLSHLYVGAGHVYSADYPNPEFNADMDPESYYIVAESSKPGKVTFMPFSQIYSSLMITKDWRLNVLGAIQTPIVQALNGFERISFAASSDWTLLDPAVSAMALYSDIVEIFRNASNSILLCGDQRGVNTNDFLTLHPNSRLVYRANVTRYKEFLVQVYSAELSTTN